MVDLVTKKSREIFQIISGTTVNVITAADYRHIMKIAIFVLDGIFEEWNGISCSQCCELYAKFSKMYMMSRKESYTENELKVFEVIIVTISSN